MYSYDSLSFFYCLTKSSFWLFAVWVGTSIKVEIGWLGPENPKTSGEFWFQFSFSVISYFPKYSVSLIIDLSVSGGEFWWSEVLKGAKIPPKFVFLQMRRSREILT